MTDPEERRKGSVKIIRTHDRQKVDRSSSPASEKMNPWQHPQSAGTFYSPVSSHYAQAYLQNTLGGFHQRASQTAPSTSNSSSASTFQSRPRTQGTHRCTYDQCTFSGSPKAVEIHMMDRHLIYPPNHNKNKRTDWDADPSLKGHVSSSPPPPQQRILIYS